MRFLNLLSTVSSLLLMTQVALLAQAGSAAAEPVVTSTAALNGALLVKLSVSAAGESIYYTVDGSVPTEESQRYEAPFLATSDMTVKAIAAGAGHAPSPVVLRALSIKVPPNTLVWSDEFNKTNRQQGEPNPAVWTYDTGNSGFGNHELETYCAWGSHTAPCSATEPSAYVGRDGYLHVVARRESSGAYSSARLKSQGLFSYQYGRFEVRARVPEAQGLWPAVWLLGNNITTVDWPACGENDILERVNAAKSPDWNEGSIHGIGFTGDVGLGTVYHFPGNENAAGWHTYGMIWKPGSIAYYVDDPAHPYVTYTPRSLEGLSGAKWPFDNGQSNFILINLAVGGDWPKSPDASSPFPSEMLIDYVRIYKSE